jgi:hypothetical protein
MADAPHNLKIKYGLRNEPTDAQVKLWAQITRKVASQGHSLDTAGAAAAKQIFPDYRTVVYASEADTIEALLRAAEGRG